MGYNGIFLEDSIWWATIIPHRLARHDIFLRPFDDYDAALKEVASTDLDLVVSDYTLSGKHIDGVRFLQASMRKLRKKNAVLILFTTYEMDEIKYFANHASRKKRIQYCSKLRYEQDIVEIMKHPS